MATYPPFPYTTQATPPPGEVVLPIEVRPPLGAAETAFREAVPNVVSSEVYMTRPVGSQCIQLGCPPIVTELLVDNALVVGLKVSVFTVPV